MCRSSSSFSSLSHFLFPRDFSGTITDRDIINTPLESLRPADVPFGGCVDIAPHFGGEIYVHSVEDSTLMPIFDQFSLSFVFLGLPKIGPNPYT